jgi:uroporphyrin-III C-methyltransferase
MAKVYLVGAGPGDPDLLTVKAHRLLKQADAVLYDRLVSAEILALINPRASMIYVGKWQGEQERVQNEIHELLLAEARPGRTVVRLKGGDPMIYARGGEEWEHLVRAGIDVEVVPGISAAFAVPSLAGIPLTYRGVAASFAVATGHRQNLDAGTWTQYRAIDTLVVLMGVEFRDIIAAQLIAAGRSPDEPIAFIERGTTRNEKVVTATLGEVARGLVEVKSPAVFVIGEVVRLRKRLRGAASKEVVLLAR